MAGPPRHRSARAIPLARQPRARRRHPGGARTPDVSRPDGHLFKVIALHAPDWPRTGGLCMTVTYRDASRADAATLDRLFDTSFCDTFAHLYRAEDLKAFLTSFGLADWEEQLDDPAFAFRIAEVDGVAGRLCEARAAQTAGRDRRAGDAVRPALRAQGPSRRGHRAGADGLGVRRGAPPRRATVIT